MVTVPIEELADEMYRLVAENVERRSYKVHDLTREMIAKHGGASVTRESCRKAIRLLVESGRCVYAEFAGSWIQLPHKECSAPD